MSAPSSALMVGVGVALLLVGAPVVAQPQELGDGEILGGPLESEPPLIELYTFGPGELIFERFGHATICLRYHDPARFPEVCFNYGVTDFGEEGTALIWNFLRGAQRFWVEPTRYATMYQYYASEDRDIWRQELALDADERRAVEAELWRNITEEHRYYVYDHFFDNCTTRIRDLLDRVTGGKLSKDATGTYPSTFRDLGKRGLAGLPPLIALADFLLGRQLDDHPTLYQAMFWPDVMRAEVATRLGAKVDHLYVRRGPPNDPVGSTGRLLMFLVALGLVAPLAVARWRGRFERVAIGLAVLAPSLWGIAIWTLVLVSPIQGVRWNELVFVLVPFDLVLPFLTVARRRRYARVRLAICFLASALAGLGLLHQPIWVPLLTAVMPLALIAVPRSRRAHDSGELVDGQRVEDVASAEPGAPGHGDGEPGRA
ncbi:MAG: DUF4105 domain-containing protein [Proteobacteria bacterium]|nr:DUF4105 domain-containing protein [Pseudomonadota bacterium]